MAESKLTIPCSCGGRAVVKAAKRGYYSHCLGCGALHFWKNSLVTERIRLEGPLCPHSLKRQKCKGAETTWCKICRVRGFYPQKQ